MKFQRDQEILMIVKTKKSVFQELVNEVKRLHPYDTPEVISTEVTHAYKPYYDWVIKETK